jgi:cobalt/nickel transport system permease protein
MHLADGIVRTDLALAAGAVTAVGLAVTSWRVDLDEIPRMGLMASALFAGSLIHFPLAGTTVHLSLLGLAGIVVGIRALPVVFAAVLLQTLIFQHGGLLSLGLNTLNMAAGALSAAAVWRLRILPEAVRAFTGGLVGVAVPAALIALELRASGYGRGVVYVLGAYAGMGLLEGGLNVAAVRFFRRMGASILEPRS